MKVGDFFARPGGWLIWKSSLGADVEIQVHLFSVSYTGLREVCLKPSNPGKRVFFGAITQILGAGILKQSPRITVLERTPKRTNPRRAPCIRFPLPGWRRGDLIRERGGRPWRLRPSGSLESVGVLSARGQAKTATGDPGSLDRNGWHCFSISQANPYPVFQKATYNE